jgi:hypothetical protein
LRADALNRFAYFGRIFDRIKTIDGDVVECGVYRGLSLILLAVYVRNEGRHRDLWGFDSFEGFPDVPAWERSQFAREGRFGDTTAGEVERAVSFALGDPALTTVRLHLKPGFFDQTLPAYQGDKIALLHLDCDLYNSYRTALTELYPRVVSGGVVCFDEYHDDNYPGATQAIREYLGDDQSLITVDQAYGRHFLVKPGSKAAAQGS